MHAAFKRHHMKYLGAFRLSIEKHNRIVFQHDFIEDGHQTRATIIGRRMMIKSQLTQTKSQSLAVSICPNQSQRPIHPNRNLSQHQLGPTDLVWLDLEPRLLNRSRVQNLTKLSSMKLLVYEHLQKWDLQVRFLQHQYFQLSKELD